MDHVLPYMQEHRKAEYDIDPLFLNRWSPRSYKSDPVTDDVLYSLLEAARWAPSGNNEQPWRLIVDRTEEEKERFYPIINEGNCIWCKQAPVLVLLVSKTVGSRVTTLPHTPLTQERRGAAWRWKRCRSGKSRPLVSPCRRLYTKEYFHNSDGSA